MSPFQTLFDELVKEIETNKTSLISKYIDMLDPKKNSDVDEFQLLDNFIEYFNEHKDSVKNYVEYMTYLRAHILLSHAAIENFLENIAKLAIKNSIQKYHETTEINSILKWFIYNSPNVTVEEQNDFDSILEKMLEKYAKILNKNNGIKKSNLQIIFTPIGITEIDFEPFDSFGTTRGFFAHHNGYFANKKLREHKKLKRNTPPNPLDFLKDIDILLSIIDKKIVKIVEEIVVEEIVVEENTKDTIVKRHKRNYRKRKIHKKDIK